MTISFAGDICSEGRIGSIIEKGCFKNYFLGVREYLSKSDYSIVNLECPICESDYLPIPKCGPNLKATPKIVDLIQYMGFKGVCLANNHISDYGTDGIYDTLKVLNDADLDSVGVGENLNEAIKPLFISSANQTIAIINCCEHEFSIVEDGKAGAAPVNPILLSYKIREVKSKCKYVAVIVHGGCEHFNLPTQRMIEMYRFFIDCGADVVVNHHQHCYSGYEVYNGKPIFYGLGNFCFDCNDSNRKQWNRGIIVTIHFDETIGFEIVPFIQNENSLGVSLCEYDSSEYLSIMNDVRTLSEILSNPKELEKQYKAFLERTNLFYRNAIEPYSYYYLRALFEKGFLPSLMNNDKKKLLYNLIACESHRDRLLKSLLDEIK